MLQVLARRFKELPKRPKTPLELDVGALGPELCRFLNLSLVPLGLNFAGFLTYLEYIFGRILIISQM